jgi:hypothetical protein
MSRKPTIKISYPDASDVALFAAAHEKHPRKPVYLEQNCGARDTKTTKTKGKRKKTC